jgi:DNA-binding MarR family transcriptional regulator
VNQERQEVVHGAGNVSFPPQAGDGPVDRVDLGGALSRLERDGLVSRSKPPHDQRRVYIDLTELGHKCFLSMSADMESNYQRIQEQFGEEKLQQLLGLLNELKQIRP